LATAGHSLSKMKSLFVTKIKLLFGKCVE
jgi:hypothetical protein